MDFGVLLLVLGSYYGVLGFFSVFLVGSFGSPAYPIPRKIITAEAHGLTLAQLFVIHKLTFRTKFFSTADFRLHRTGPKRIPSRGPLRSHCRDSQNFRVPVDRLDL